MLGRVTAKAEADRRARLPIVETERTKHVARPSRAARAGATQRKGDIAQVGNKPRRINAFPADVEISMVAAIGAAIDYPARSKCVDCGLPQLFDMVVIASAALFGECRCSAKANT